MLKKLVLKILAYWALFAGLGVVLTRKIDPVFIGVMSIVATLVALSEESR